MDEAGLWDSTLPGSLWLLPLTCDGKATLALALRNVKQGLRAALILQDLKQGLRAARRDSAGLGMDDAKLRWLGQPLYLSIRIFTRGHP